MALVKWQPKTETLPWSSLPAFNSLWQEIDRLFQSFSPKTTIKLSRKSSQAHSDLLGVRMALSQQSRTGYRTRRGFLTKTRCNYGLSQVESVDGNRHAETRHRSTLSHAF